MTAKASQIVALTEQARPLPTARPAKRLPPVSRHAPCVPAAATHQLASPQRAGARREPLRCTRCAGRGTHQLTGYRRRIPRTPAAAPPLL